MAMAEPNETDDSSAMIEGGLVESFNNLPHKAVMHRAETAKRMAFLLVWILAGSVGIHFTVTAIFAACGLQEATELLAKIFNMWLPVISGLVSSAATYYFTKESQR
jgi:hypothetical protein